MTYKIQRKIGEAGIPETAIKETDSAETLTYTELPDGTSATITPFDEQKISKKNPRIKSYTIQRYRLKIHIPNSSEKNIPQNSYEDTIRQIIDAALPDAAYAGQNLEAILERAKIKTEQEKGELKSEDTAFLGLVEFQAVSAFFWTATSILLYTITPKTPNEEILWFTINGIMASYCALMTYLTISERKENKQKLSAEHWHEKTKTYAAKLCVKEECDEAEAHELKKYINRAMQTAGKTITIERETKEELTEILKRAYGPTRAQDYRTAAPRMRVSAPIIDAQIEEENETQAFTELKEDEEASQEEHRPKKRLAI